MVSKTPECLFLSVSMIGETQLSDLSVRPGQAVDVNGARIGYVELRRHSLAHRRTRPLTAARPQAVGGAGRLQPNVPLQGRRAVQAATPSEAPTQGGMSGTRPRSRQGARVQDAVGLVQSYHPCATVTPETRKFHHIELRPTPTDARQPQRSADNKPEPHSASVVRPFP